MAPDYTGQHTLEVRSRQPFHLFLDRPALAKALMILYSLRFLWVASRGYRLRPWRSPYLRWRIETYSGIPADQVTYEVFRKFLWKERRELWRFLAWGAEMRKLEKRLRREAEPPRPARH